MALLCYSYVSCQSDSYIEKSAPITFEETQKQIKDSIFFRYAWKEKYNFKDALVNCISPPKNYIRVDYSSTSFQQWLRHLPLKQSDVVYLYNGEKKYNQQAQFKVIDIDIGNKDLQQCADAVMRLRAEFLYSSKQFDKIKFNYTNGTPIPFSKWSDGYFPSLQSNKVVWISSSKNNSSYPSFKKYLINIFMYAGTSSLEKELKNKNIKEITTGDVFIKGGFPGHAVIVVDVAINTKTNEKCFLLAQSYMPAQNIHILKNPKNSDISPWYSVNECLSIIETPEWTFNSTALKSFE